MGVGKYIWYSKTKATVKRLPPPSLFKEVFIILKRGIPSLEVKYLEFSAKWSQERHLEV